MTINQELIQLRENLSKLDRDIFFLVKKRQQICQNIGQIKRQLNIADRDIDREQALFDHAINLAKELDLPKDFAVKLQQELMAISLFKQEQDRIKQSSVLSKLNVTVIGGSGRMGKWMCNFLSNLGHFVTVIDKAKPDFTCTYKSKIDQSIQDEDLLVISTPIRTSATILEHLLSFNLKKPVIFDLASIKSPVKNILFKMKESGVKVTSIHPMFGPGVPYLFGRHIVRTSLGVNEADNMVEKLFKDTPLVLVDMGFDEHDQITSYLLAVSHFVNIALVDCLKNSGYSIKELLSFSSTTFLDQLNIAKRVFLENHQLYYEIQALNPSNSLTFENFLDSITQLLSITSNGKETEFLKIMKEGQEFLAKNE